jgi:hypothetical protein
MRRQLVVVSASMKAIVSVHVQAASSSSHWSVRLKDILLPRIRGMRDARKARASEAGCGCQWVVEGVHHLLQITKVEDVDQLYSTAGRNSERQICSFGSCGWSC